MASKICFHGNRIVRRKCLQALVNHQINADSLFSIATITIFKQREHLMVEYNNASLLQLHLFEKCSDFYKLLTFSNACLLIIQAIPEK